jgi:predicted nucleic acid-binding protein
MTARGVGRARREVDRAYVDTNLVVALFAGPNHPLHERSLDIFQRVAEGTLNLILTPVVVAELVYVTGSLFRWSRRSIGERLAALLEADGLVLIEGPTLLRALRLYGEGTRLDFPDAYLAAAALTAGPPVIASFDSDFDTVAGVTRIAA